MSHELVRIVGNLLHEVRFENMNNVKYLIVRVRELARVVEKTNRSYNILHEVRVYSNWVELFVYLFFWNFPTKIFSTIFFRFFPTASSMLYHVYHDHLLPTVQQNDLDDDFDEDGEQNPEQPVLIQCRWPLCDNTPRALWSLTTHMQVEIGNCLKNNLKNGKIRA